MGLLMYDALVLSRVVREIAHPDNCLALGVPTLNFSDESFFQQLKSRPEFRDFEIGNAPFDTAKGFFKNLGFQEASFLDISDYEGADIIADLNDPNVADKVSRRFDLLYDSGTVEHIFDAPTALRNIARLIRIGGAVVHATPCNGFVDHGFWQVSPDLYKTFYTEAGFEVLTTALFVFADRPYAMAVDDNLYRTKGRKFISSMAGEAILVFAARKKREGNLGKIELQDYYAQMHADTRERMSSKFFIEYGEFPPRPEPRWNYKTSMRRLAGKVARNIGLLPS